MQLHLSFRKKVCSDLPSRMQTVIEASLAAQPSDGQYPSYGDQNYAPYLQQQPLVAVDTHYPILVDHVDKFHVGDDISPEDLPSSALRAAPSRPLPYATNAVQPPTTGLWSWHTGGLDKRRCRKWTKMNRTLTTIGGGTALVKAWIGGSSCGNPAWLFFNI